MNFNTVSQLNFNKNNKLKIQKRNINHFKNNAYSNFSVNCYPKTYYLNQPSFGRRTLATDIINRLGEESFPNPEIYEKLKNIGRSDDFSLYDIHLECYKDLLDCTTLDEAKERYPEFKDVIDIKNIDCNTLTGNSTLSKILKGNIKDTDIDNFTLELLKKYYGKLIRLSNTKEYWGIKPNDISIVFDALNIKKLCKKYLSTIICYSDEQREKRSKSMKERRSNPNSAYNTDEYKAKRSKIAKDCWKNPEYREKQSKTKNTDEYIERHSKLALERWQDPEYREKWYKSANTRELEAKKSQSMIERWQDPNSIFNSEEYREKRSELMIEKWQDPEFREKQTKARNTDEYIERHSKLAVERWQDPEYREKQAKAIAEKRQNLEYREKLLQTRNKAFKKHPEIISMMSEVRKSFPRIGEIIDKKKRGIELTEEEKNYRFAYYMECEKAMPGYRQIIADEQQKILAELGFKGK